MCAKKKTIPNKIWKLAGEPLRSQPLSAAEQEQFAEEFSIYREIRGSSRNGLDWVTPAAARLHQSAAQSVAAFLCGRYAGRYSREAVVKVTAATAAIPASVSARMADRTDFLLGGALWLLDYWEEHCGDEDEYLSLLPLEPDGALEYSLPFSEDLSHSREKILCLLTALHGRDKAYRKEFRALLDLVDADAAAELRCLFKDTFLDYMDRAMEIHSRLQPVEQEIPAFPADLSGSDRFWEGPPPPPPEDPAFIAALAAPELICRPAPEIQEELGSRKAAELLSGYGTDEPYALCAAYLLLEQEKDALANLNALTAIVMICAARHLPWSQDDFGARAGLFERGRPDYRLRYEYREADEDGEIHTDDPPDCLVSEAQLFYIATGIVPPRNHQPSGELIHWFISQGIPEPRARELAFGAMFAYYSDDGEYGWEEFDWPLGKEEEAERPEGPEEGADTPASPPSGEPPIQTEALIRQVKELQSALHDAERTAGRLKEQLQMAEQKGGADRAELAQLRETLYNLRGGEAPEAGDSGPLVELPWQVKRRVVVFGGHDSWRKAVKPLLPGARFYDREVLPDLNAIRGADVVWLQANALSHKYYYRIIDTARKNDIPVRYFGSASAQKCAVQLALDELHGGG